MKLVINCTVFILLLFYNNSCYSKTSILSPHDKISSFTKIWGFLKYYHPEIADGNQDWDSVYITSLKKLKEIKTKFELNVFYENFIVNQGKVDSSLFHSLVYDTTVTKVNPLLWIDTTSLFSNTVKDILHNISIHRVTKNNYYVKKQKHNGAVEFINELSYYDWDVPPANELALLTLARYWNMVQYYYPHKHLLEKSWDNILSEYIPIITMSHNRVSYLKAITALIYSINDSHTNIPNMYLYRIPSKVKVYDDRAVIVSHYNNYYAKMNDLQVGDVILSVDSVSIDSLIKKNSLYTSGSNYTTKLRNMGFYLISKDSDSAMISFTRGSKEKYKKIGLYRSSQFTFESPTIKKGLPPYYIIEGNIGYIQAGLSDAHTARKAIKNFKKNTKAIIIDLRAYPKWNIDVICKLLSRNKKTFAYFVQPDYTYPGTFVLSDSANCGKRRNSAEYSGKIIILVNEYTQSRGEYFALAFRTLPDCIVIGNNTAGAVGNASNVLLPHDIKFMFTGLRILDQNKKEVHKVGIIPDILVEETSKSIKANEDEILNKALQYIHEN